MVRIFSLFFSKKLKRVELSHSGKTRKSFLQLENKSSKEPECMEKPVFCDKKYRKNWPAEGFGPVTCRISNRFTSHTCLIPDANKSETTKSLRGNGIF